ncbi:ring finger protein [Reticulomyxa filosa]|uniref:Ring finger protein n=1 Tax=Reticulomyxa filosa TaxID=46433 RepID=X6PD77_RETFI|nr:ring finger protein [Reticulomyxa filosa]|eukprot:ETO35632.1 ring finger protein [Reticulomyxa filosa]
MRRLGVKHSLLKSINTSVKNKNDEVLLELCKNGFLQDNKTICNIIEHAKKMGLKDNRCVHFIHDLLEVSKKIEKITDADHEKNYRELVCRMFWKPEEFVNASANERDIIKLQRLEEMVRNQWITEDFNILSFESILLNRVFEHVFMNSTDPLLLDNKLITNNDTIQTISKIKVMLIKHIYWMAEHVRPSEIENNHGLFEALGNVTPLLTYFDDRNERYQHSLHVWFLKQFYVLKGMDWTRSVFTHPTIHDNCHVFVTNYSDFKKQLLTGLETGAFNLNYNGDHKNFIPLLVCSLTIVNLSDFKEYVYIYLFFFVNGAFLGKDLQNYLLERKVLQSEVETNFCKAMMSLRRSPSAEAYRLERMQDSLDVIMARLCFHFLGILQTMNKNPFRMLLEDPEAFLSGYLPAMPDDLLAPLARALRDNSDGQSFTVRYCPNGHPFFINGCGHPVEKIVCRVDGCGAVVGDPSHVAADTGFKEREVPKGKTKRRYLLDGSKEELAVADYYWTYQMMTMIRYLQQIPCTLLRLLIHLPLLIRDASTVNGCPKIQRLVKKGNQKTTTEFLRNQAKGNFLLLGKLVQLNEEQLCIALHDLLVDFGKSFNEWYPQGLTDISLSATYELERKVDIKYGAFFGNKTRLNELRNKSSIEEKKCNVKDFELILSEIQEQESVLNESYRANYLPHLFLCTRRLLMTDLLEKFTNDKSLQSKYPLLYQILFPNDGLWLLKYLPNIGAWMKYIYLRYFRQISEAQCKQITITEVLSNCGEGEYQKMWSDFKTCWNRLARTKVENECKTFVVPELDNDKQIGVEFCMARDSDNGLIILKIIGLLQKINNKFLENCRHYRERSRFEWDEDNKDGSEEKKESFFENIVDERAEEKLNIAPPVSSDKQKNVKEDIWAVNGISLFELTPKDVVCLDEAKVNEIIRQWSLPVVTLGDINKRTEHSLDFQSIEHELYNRFVRGRQILEIAVSNFQFSNELRIENCLETIAMNNPQISKERLDPRLWDTFISSFESPVQKQRTLEILSDVIVFLHQNIKKIDPLSRFMSVHCVCITPLNQRLAHLMEKLSFDQSDCAFFDVRTKEVNDHGLCVKHIFVLWKNLSSMVKSEFTDESSIDEYVLDIYQKPLANQMFEQLRTFVTKTPLAITRKILESWRNLAQEQGQKPMNVNAKISDYLENCYLFENEMEFFPKETILWENCSAAYAYVYQQCKK